MTVITKFYCNEFVMHEISKQIHCMHVSFHMQPFVFIYMYVFTNEYIYRKYLNNTNWELKYICENKFIKQLPVYQLVFLTFNNSKQ